MTRQEKSTGSPSSHRRDFLKTSLTAASAVAVGGLSLARGAHAAGSDVIRVGLIGCGNRGPGAAVNALTVDPGARLVAMGDIFPDHIRSRREMLKKAFPNQVQVDDAHCFTGLDSYKHVIDSADVVLVALAAKYHPVYLKAGIEAGKHVFVEKPHAIDPVGVRQITAASELAKQKGLSIMSGLQSRYQPQFQEIVKRIHDGAIGDVVAIEEHFERGPYNLVPRDPKLNEVEFQFSNQMHFTWLSGDDMSQSLAHNLDRSLWVLKEQVPQRCHGLGGRSASFGEIYGNVFDHHAAMYEYDNGVRIYAYCRTQNGCYGSAESVVLGSKGRCFMYRGVIEGENKWKYSGPPANPYDLEHKAFFAAIRSGNPVNCGGYMARSGLVTVMGQLACYCGRELTSEQVAKSDFVFAPKADDVRLDMAAPVKPDEKGWYPVPMPGITEFNI
jgi:myo-inositol 2-dehydrogenase / D-chiro-inositol 1-dehydrogenase